MSDTPLSMSINLSVLRHLGLNLYSNAPAVLSEVVANAWDADAEHIQITISADQDTIEIVDDGHGMSRVDLKDKYLNVGYERRAAGEILTPRLSRPVMGRKGIGKLSLFSIADVVEVHTTRLGKTTSIRMVTSKIEATIKSGQRDYEPEEIACKPVITDSGTRIVLQGLKKSISRTSEHLRRRLARRFGVIGDAWKFNISVDGAPVTLEDRGYFHKIEQMWWVGEPAETVAADLVVKNDYVREVDCNVECDGETYKISGWIGTAKQSGKYLIDEDDSLNRIVLLMRGKVAHENLLDLVGETGHYASFLMGEISADYLDDNEQDDIATSSRQNVKEDDPRFVALIGWLKSILDGIHSDWSMRRRNDALSKAQEFPAVREWYVLLNTKNKERAARLFGAIGKIAAEDVTERRELVKHAILAFESLRQREELDLLEGIDENNVEGFIATLNNLDDIEASKYLSIVRGRVEIIRKLDELAGSTEKEKVIQRCIADHLWLIDPSWERATKDMLFEKSFATTGKAMGIGDVKLVLNKDELKSRFDIKFMECGGTHVIVELKKPSVILELGAIVAQCKKYNEAFRKLLIKVGRSADPVKIIFLVGKLPKSWEDAAVRTMEKRMLAEMNVELFLYSELVDKSLATNSAYLEARREVRTIEETLARIDTELPISDPAPSLMQRK